MPTLFEETALPKGKPVKSQHQSSVKKPSTMTPLTCFAVNPSGVRFETQEEDEEVVLFLRQHLIVNVPWVLFSILFVLIPPVFFPLVLRLVHFPFVIPAGYIVIGTLFWYLATVGFILMNFLRWFFNIYIVTNERVVDIDFVQLLYKQFSEARLSKLQDISYSTGGILATLFNYGTVNIETAGESPNLEFESVPSPERVVETISKLNQNIQQSPL
ncbi:hypothetical protein A2973_02590 [Candidatus Gottesmanbacteria bacterium RIFCSPLOWO2_01_FULL_49_10]|uniref:YdbS-like PH domain-containing protein n=1 Tax=Candidatus Gottesmanbacteria bacterium RIFCSPLOWO2_01_FULL_49_10 TaxID=1798396 RepID=A0A1F6B2M1_9BACT|nr:MAG: hypothetical protein UY10_C0004G0007 [Microgenomates group bacterium GW2011_GWA2_47_8]OGG30787.1 MAG: hypothetical protein A2973_02590 [Candidatus Gottesmanbacteria bacterium RIFCSPLOWO2_01_FULL_49_10]